MMWTNISTKKQRFYKLIQPVKDSVAHTDSVNLWDTPQERLGVLITPHASKTGASEEEPFR